MSAPTPSHRPLTQLTRKIEQDEVDRWLGSSPRAPSFLHFLWQGRRQRRYSATDHSGCTFIRGRLLLPLLHRAQRV
jgi:hypothetical protein